MSSRDTGVMKKTTAAEMVECYLETVNLTCRAYALLDEAQAKSQNVYGESFNFLPDRGSLKYNGLKPVLFDMKKKAWRQIIDALEIRKVMSIKKWEELDKMLHDGKDLPEITMDNVRQMSEGLVANVEQFAMEAILECYEFLRPGATEWNEHKTNVKNGRYALGKKIILTRVLSWGFSRSTVDHYRHAQLTAVDMMFHRADGKLMKQNYLSPLIDAINTTDGCGETDYFKFKKYGNGNLHLEFKRPDLVAKLNRIAGGARFTGE